MTTITGYGVEKLFLTIEEKLKNVKMLWTSGKTLNKEVFELNILMMDLSEALQVDLEEETQRATDILEYVHTRLLEDIEEGKIV